MDEEKGATRRSSRAMANDAAIREAAVGLILRSGIDAISFRDVGREAGLTHGALYARFEDVEELLVDLWSELLCQRMIYLVESARNAATHPSEESIDALLDYVRNASDEDVAAVLVLLTSRRFIVLQEEVEAFIHDFLEIKEGEDRALQSRALVLFSIVMVKIFTNFSYGIDLERVAFLRVVLLQALRVDPADVMDAPMTNPHVLRTPLLRDNFRAQLAFSTYSAVGRSGYTRATISRISRRAKTSPGAIYKLYPSKEELVVGSIRAQMNAPGITAARVAQILDEGILAQFIFAAASDQDAVRKFFTLEMLMAAANNETIKNAVSAQFDRFNSFDSYVAEISDVERKNLRFMIRELIVLILGVSFLTTLTPEAASIDFSQFAEPFRRSLLSLFPSWPEITRQLKEVAPTLPAN